MSLMQAKLIFSEMSKILQIGDGILNDDGMCQLILKDKRMPRINFCYLDGSDEILIFSEIGFVESSMEAEVFKRLMCRQYLLDRSNNVTFSIAPDNTVLTAQLKLPVAIINGDDLASAVENFVNEVAFVKANYLSKKAEEDEDKTASLAQNLLSGIIA